MDTNPKRELLQVVSVKSCVPGHADRPGTGEKIAILRLLLRGKTEQPMLLSIAEVKTLVVALTEVLAFHQVAFPAELRDSIIVSEEAPYQPGKDTPRPVIVPSRRANTPTGPIQSDEVEKFLAGLSRVKTWNGFMKHVGVENAPPVTKPKSRRKKGKGRDGK